MSTFVYTSHFAGDTAAASRDLRIKPRHDTAGKRTLQALLPGERLQRRPPDWGHFYVNWSLKQKYSKCHKLPSGTRTIFEWMARGYTTGQPVWSTLPSESALPFIKQTCRSSRCSNHYFNPSCPLSMCVCVFGAKYDNWNIHVDASFASIYISLRWQVIWNTSWDGKYRLHRVFRV